MSQVKVFVTDRQGRTDGRMSFNVTRFRERRGTKNLTLGTGSKAWLKLYFKRRSEGEFCKFF